MILVLDLREVEEIFEGIIIFDEANKMNDIMKNEQVIESASQVFDKSP